LKDKWPGFVKEMESLNRSLYLILKESEPKGIENGKFVLGVKYKIYAERICEKKNQPILKPIMEKVFGVKPSKIYETSDNAYRITYHSAHLGRFFERFCGTGSHNKHIPSLLWDLPKDYFLEFLKGYTDGDGYTTKTGKLVASSVSKKLITELSWLCSMYGIKVGVKHEIVPEGRIIKDKPLPKSEVWTLIIGRTVNPFLGEKVEYPNQFKRAIVKKIVKKPFKGYVYDLCGVENEAFLGAK